MHTLYDTRTVHPLDRYEYYRAGAADEVAPVSVHGRPPGQMLAVMTVAQIGDFKIETFTWATDCAIVARRTVGSTPMRVIKLTFPQALVPIDRTTVRPLVGTLAPRSQSGRSLICWTLASSARLLPNGRVRPLCDSRHCDGVAGGLVP